jgi:sulfonate transport system permease protein
MVTVAAILPAGRRPRRELPLGWVPASVGFATVVGLWIVGGKRHWAEGMIVTPTEAIRPLLGDSREVYVRATQATVSASLRGLVIGSVIAIAAALVAVAAPPLRRTISRLAAIANAAPWVAVAPCLLVVLGRSRGPTAVASIATFFSVFVAASIGLSSSSRAAHDVLTALGAPRRLHLRALQIPSASASVLDGLRLAAPAALAGAIFGEWYGADRGLGVLLISGMQSGRADRLWAASLISAGCGLLAFGFFAIIRSAVATRYGSSVTQSTVKSTRRRAPLTTVAIETATTAFLGVLLILAWYVWIELADVSPLVVPRPSRVWRDVIDAPGMYGSATGATLVTAFWALLIGAVVGAMAALAATRFRLVAGAAVPIVVLLAATPLVALLPLFARVFGYEARTVRLLAATMVFFPVFVYARSGLSAAAGPPGDVLDALGSSPDRRFRLLTLPAAVPHIVSGLRIATSSAVVAAVVGESLIGRHGLGVQFTAAYRSLAMPRAFGSALLIVVVSVVVFAAAGAAERVVHTRWT